ncbi:hypothetical protein [Rhodospirillum rubrum]|uniref:hypothetical protein n=1 Tax=Rhodospirillum rubrum TaxID=1085 RepID=UPI001F5BEEF0|nr:hypothetical protein [Rhodospirillum rubrum]
MRLIGLDSLQPGSSGGALSACQRAWLDSALSEAAFLDKPVVLFLHHPPFPMGINHLDAARLEQSETLGLLLDRHRGAVVRLLCGHAHRHVTTVWHGVAVTVCPAPAFAFALDFAQKAPAAITLEPPALLLHRWDERARLLVTHVSPIGLGERRSYGGERPTVGV